ncbi:MAG: hypothetical protein ABFS30_12885, partial [Pseudomonadota bacterium]
MADNKDDDKPQESAGPDNPGPSDADGHEEKRRKALSFTGRLRAYFLAGILVTAPLAITIALASWLIEFVDSRIVPLIPLRYNPDVYLKEYLGYEIGIPGLGLIVLIVFITLVGAMSAGFHQINCRIFHGDLRPQVGVYPFHRGIFVGHR